MESTANLGRFQSVWTFEREISDEWVADMSNALAVLQERDGFLSASIVQSVDEGSRCLVLTTWIDVGSYRRAVSSTRAKMVVWPMLADMKDEPSAFEELVLLTPSGIETFSSSADHS